MKRVRGLLGGKRPFLNQSKASKIRVLDAIIATGATLYGAAKIGGDSARDAIIYSVEVDEDKVAELERSSMASLTPHDDIQIGFDVMKSVKAVIYDEEGEG